MEEYKYWTVNKQIIWIWIRHLRFELTDYYNSTKSAGYTCLINNSLSSIESCFRNENYDRIIEYCSESMRKIKFINGNHFHIWLFYILEELIKEYKELIKEYKELIK